MNQHNIKRASWSDLDQLATLFNQYRTFYDQPSNKSAAEHFLKQRFFFGESIIFLASLSKEGSLVATGFTQLYPLFSSVRLTKNWILNDLFVHPDFRRQQVAKKLIEVAISFAKSAGSGFLQLETAPDNHPAQALYEASGFKKQPADNEFVMYRLDLLSQ